MCIQQYKFIQKKVAKQKNKLFLCTKINQMENQTSLKWEPTDSFTFNGHDFAILHNTLQNIINSPAYAEQLQLAKNTIAIGQLYELSSKKLQEGIESGIVVPMTPPEPVSDTETHIMD